MIEIQLDPLHGINRKARHKCIIINRDPEYVASQWYVYPVDETGVEITHPLFKRYAKEFIADHSTMVDPATGAYVQQINVGTEEAPVMGYPAGSITEYQFFSYMAANVQIVLDNMILASGLQAKAAGRFDLV